MSSEWSGCFYDKKVDDGVAECIADLFYEPSSYDELCFYCVEGAYCPRHETPEPRVRVRQKEGNSAAESMNYVLDEIFGLRNDRWLYTSCEIEIAANSRENAAVEAEQQNFTEKRSVSVDEHNKTQRIERDVKSMALERYPNQDPTDRSKDGADDALKMMCEDVEEVFIGPKRRKKLSPIRNDRQKYQRFRNKQYLCDICDSAFTLKHNIQTHLLLYHPNNETYMKRRRGKRYRCLKCNAKHQKRQHEVRMRPKCATCQKEFPTSSLLREHVAVIHLNLRPFKCAKCSAVFGRQGCLRRHDMMRHLNYVYVCPYKQCTHPGFKCSKALTAHIRSIHTHVRPYKCEQCEKCFVRRNDLRVHSDIHNTECKYVCPTCKQKFQRRIHFQKHSKKCHPK